MADHIRIARADGAWVVRAGGAVIAETQDALELHEGSRPPVIYFPPKDIATAFLDGSDSRSHCRWKGEATYFSIQTSGRQIPDAAWSYPDPIAGAEAIRGHIAFYETDEVTVERL